MNRAVYCKILDPKQYHVYEPAILYTIFPGIRIPDYLLDIRGVKTISPLFTNFVRVSSGYVNHNKNYYCIKTMAFLANSDGGLFGDHHINYKYFDRLSLQEASLLDSQVYHLSHIDCLKKLGYYLSNTDPSHEIIRCVSQRLEKTQKDFEYDYQD